MPCFYGLVPGPPGRTAVWILQNMSSETDRQTSFQDMPGLLNKVSHAERSA